MLVTDFDGTLTRHDFYQLVRDRLLPPETPDFFDEYRAGQITHFDALRLIFAEVPAGAEVFSELARDQELDPDLAAEVGALRENGWEVVVVSAGCRWYIDLLLAEAGVEAQVHASPGRIEEGRLLMEWPLDSPFYSPETGIDKAAVVRAALAAGRTVAYAGDGPVDLEAALLVPAEYRFARRTRDLAELLRSRGERFHPFDRWAEIARTLRSESSG